MARKTRSDYNPVDQLIFYFIFFLKNILILRCYSNHAHFLSATSSVTRSSILYSFTLLHGRWNLNVTDFFQLVSRYWLDGVICFGLLVIDCFLWLGTKPSIIWRWNAAGCFYNQNLIQHFFVRKITSNQSRFAITIGRIWLNRNFRSPRGPSFGINNFLLSCFMQPLLLRSIIPDI